MPELGQDGTVVRNKLLAVLPPSDLSQLLSECERVSFSMGQSLLRVGERIDHVIFPEIGWLSHVIATTGSDGAEVGLVGREGMAGLPILLGDDRSTSELIVQGVGYGFQLRSATFSSLLDDMPVLRSLLLRYTLAFQMQVAQTAACNGRHKVEQRLARWLLTVHDRADGETFAMTHDFLSLMLGVRRAGVTVAARSLQQAGLIGYRRGGITVTDRIGLEASSCGCYRTVRDEFERLLGDASGAPGLAIRPSC